MFQYRVLFKASSFHADSRAVNFEADSPLCAMSTCLGFMRVGECFQSLEFMGKADV